MVDSKENYKFDLGVKGLIREENYIMKKLFARFFFSLKVKVTVQKLHFFLCKLSLLLIQIAKIKLC